MPIPGTHAVQASMAKGARRLKRTDVKFGYRVSFLSREESAGELKGPFKLSAKIREVLLLLI